MSSRFKTFHCHEIIRPGYYTLNNIYNFEAFNKWIHSRLDSSQFKYFLAATYYVLAIYQKIKQYTSSESPILLICVASLLGLTYTLMPPFVQLTKFLHLTTHAIDAFSLFNHFVPWHYSTPTICPDCDSGEDCITRSPEGPLRMKQHYLCVSIKKLAIGQASFKENETFFFMVGHVHKKNQFVLLSYKQFCTTLKNFLIFI